MRSSLVPRVVPSKMKAHRFKDYFLRFAFGAGISLVAGLIGMSFGPKVGGVMLAFPAILPASLTLIQKKEGKEAAAIDSVGASLGAAAMIAFAVFVSATASTWGAVPSVLIALVVWLSVAVGFYFLVAILYEREPAPP